MSQHYNGRVSELHTMGKGVADLDLEEGFWDGVHLLKLPPVSVARFPTHSLGPAGETRHIGERESLG